MIDPITENDLAAYVDGELSPMRRVDVEAHLAHHPEDAALVMADLRDRDALRAAYGTLPTPGSESLRHAARRIDRAMAWQRVGQRLRRAAAVVVLVGAGWLAHTEAGTLGVPDTQASPIDPALAEEAQQARQVAQLRARTATQRAVSSYDQADLEAATGLDLPDLPAGWVVRDVQIFPGRQSAGIEVSIDAGGLGELALFVRRSDAVGADAVSWSADGTTAYWRNGSTAYALSGSSDSRALHEATAQVASLKH